MNMNVKGAATNGLIESTGKMDWFQRTVVNVKALLGTEIITLLKKLG
jgi:hypothetical protein